MARGLSTKAVEASEGIGGVTIPEKRRSGVSAAYRKGTGGRMSFSGNVCTVFGNTGMLGEVVVNRLGLSHFTLLSAA